MKPEILQTIREASNAVINTRAKAAESSNAAGEAEIWAQRAKRLAAEAEAAADEAAILLSRVLDAVRLAEAEKAGGT